MNLSLHAVAELITLRFVDSLAEGTLVCLLAALCLRLARRQNAATRFAVWFSALVAISASPWVGGAKLPGEVLLSGTHSAAITLPDSFALYFIAVWAVVAIWFGVGIARALWHLNALRRNSIPVDPAEIDPIVRETLQRHGANRRIELCTSEQVRVPTAVGLLKPVILVPKWIFRELSSDELNQILLHELAHFRRWDDWTNLAQQAMKAVFFFHPAVWWIDKKVAIEREMACDDAVLAETRSPRAYAECLAHLAEKTFVQRSVALAQAALGKMRQTSARLARILDVNRPSPSSPSWVVAASLVLTLALGCGALYSRVPRLVAFGSSARPHPQEVAAIDASSVPVPGYFRAVPVVQAKLKLARTPARLEKSAVPQRTSSPQRVTLVRTKSLTTEQRTLVNLTDAKVSPVPVTETFWVVVEREGANPAAPLVYQIQMWRVTVLRTVFTVPSRQISRNET
jgi:beta-lactamase regulating signal transducer with metallopeptidase domain